MDELLLEKEREGREDRLRAQDLWRDMFFASFEEGAAVTDKAFADSLRFADMLLEEYRSRF
jgi:hypothetical protein